VNFVIDNLRDIVVTWSTRGSPNASVVQFARNYLNDKLTTVNGTWQRFVDGGKKARVQYIHNVELKDLKPDPCGRLCLRHGLGERGGGRRVHAPGGDHSRLCALHGVRGQPRGEVVSGPSTVKHIVHTLGATFLPALYEKNFSFTTFFLFQLLKIRIVVSLEICIYLLPLNFKQLI